MVRYLHLVRFAVFVAVLMANAIVVYSQTIQTSGSGTNWNDNGSWVGGVIPTAANSSSIQIDHNINIPSGYTAIADQITVGVGINLTVDSGGTLNLQNSGGTDLSLTEDFFIFFIGANLIVNGDFINNSQTALDLGSGLSTTTFNSGGRYVHAINGQSLPFFGTTWDANSTCEITGVTNSVPGNLNQTFGHLTWNSSGHTGNLALGLTATTINGNFSILNTNSPNILTLASSNGTIDINGNFIVSGTSRFLGTPTSNVTIDLEGDFSFSSTGLLSLLISSTGTLNFDISGDFIVTSGTLQAYAVGSATANINFVGASPQIYAITGSPLVNNFNWRIVNGSTVDMGTSPFVNGGSFTLEAGATMNVGSPDGLSTGTSLGNVRVSGTRTYTANGNITYNGTTQNLGTEWGGAGALNGVAVNLEIADGAIVTNNIIGSTSLVGNLTLTSGTLHIGNSNTLQIQSDFNGNGGNLGGVATSNLTFSGSGAITGLLSFASGARNLNDFTINRAGTINLGSDLTIGGTLSFASSGNLNIDQFNGQTLTINGDITQGGSGSLVSGSNFTSNLVIGGSGALSSLPICTVCGSMELNNLTLGRTGGGTYTWNSAVTILNAVNLNSGTLTHTSGLTMGAGSTFNRSSGSSISSSPLNSGAYNIAYNGTLTTGPELPVSTTAINNLTIGGDVTLNKDITVNGTLTFSSGTFNAGSNLIDIKGNLVSNAGSTLTSSEITFSGTTVISGISAPVFGDITITGTLTPSANFNINGNMVNNGTLNAGSATVTFGGTTTISGSSTHNFNSVAITGTLNAPANMNVAGNWNNTGTFNRGIASNTVTFNGTTSFTGNGLTQFSSIVIANSSTLTSRPVLPLNVAGNFTNNGTFNAGTGTLLLNGSAVQNISGTTVTTFNNITVTNAATPISVRVQSDQNIRGILTLSGSTTVFDADGVSNTAVLTLLSSDDEPSVVDAAIAAIPAGAQLTGNVTVQRYMSIEGGSNPTNDNGRIYRYISSPVSGAPVSQIQNFIPVTGPFTGSSSCSGCGSTQTMFLYNESELTDTNGSGTPDLNDGYENFPQTVNSETLATGRGYTLLVRGNIAPVSTAGNALWSVRNPINSGTIDFVATAGVSYTAGNGPTNDGWNLVGNPYPSTIDWDAASGWVKTGLSNVIYMRDNGSASGTYASYVGGIGGTNGGSRYIPIGQAFWVQAVSTPTFTATEAVKAPGNTTEFFRTAPPSDMLRVTLRNGINRDEILVYFDDEATDSYDQNLDAHKLRNSIFNIATYTEDGIEVAINGLSKLGCSMTLPLKISNISSGTYQLDFSEFESFETPADILLHDKITGENIDVTITSSYEFQVGSEETDVDRFELVFLNRTIDPTLLVTSVENGVGCNDGAVVLSADGAPVGGGYKWYESEDDIMSIDGQNGFQFETPILEKTKTYYVSVVNEAGCEGPRTAVVADIITFDDVDISEDGNKLISSYSEGNQWFKDGQIIAGATGKVYEPEESGVYQVEVSVGSCKTSSERAFTVTEVESDPLFGSVVQSYPNPVSNILTIKFRNEAVNTPKMMDLNGREIGEFNLKTEGEFTVGTFDFKGFANGIYLLQIVNSNGKIFNKRIFKN